MLFAADDGLNFWRVLWLCLIVAPMVLCWVAAIVDIFRRDDMSGAKMALWLIIVVVLPIVGTVVYLLTRPPAATRAERARIAQESQFMLPRPPTSRAEQLTMLSDLHDRGKLSDEEFAAQKLLAD